MYKGPICPLKGDLIKNYYWTLLSSIDILCFQEHKLTGDKLLSFGKHIWPRALFFGREASLGYGHDLGDVGAGKGGVCMWISPKLQNMVQSSGYSRCGRAQWVRLQGTPDRDLAILNVYASTIVLEHIEFWDELTTCLFKDCRWVLCGDWNFVEH